MVDAALKKATGIDYAEVNAAKARVGATAKAAAAEDRFARIEVNPVYQVVFDPSRKPDQKRDAVALLLTADGTKEQNQENVHALETFQEYLQHVRQGMAEKIIALTNTEAMGELKDTYESLNGDLIRFDDEMRPLTDIIDAVYKLRVNGAVETAFRAIKQARAEAEDRAARLAARKAELDAAEADIHAKREQILRLAEKRRAFGLLGPGAATMGEIKVLEAQIADRSAELERIGADIAAIAAESGAGFGEFAAETEQLKALLDISGEEHKERQKRLVDTATRFISNAQERIGSVREHLGRMDGQIESLTDANGKMINVYAVLNDGIQKAGKTNGELRAAVAAAPEGETMLEQATRTEKQGAIDDHVRALDAAAVDTASTFADLSTQQIRIKGMRDANKTQIAKARQMSTAGIAGVADRLSTVLNGVSAAALGEASGIAKDTLLRMTASTSTISQKESIRQAMGFQEVNEDMARVMQDLESYGESTRAATELARAGVREMKENAAAMRRMAEQVQSDVRDAIAVNSEVGLALERGTAAKEGEAGRRKPAGAGSPFGL